MSMLSEVHARRIRSALPSVIVLLLIGNAVALAAYEQPPADEPTFADAPVTVPAAGAGESSVPTPSASAPTTKAPASKKKSGTTTTTAVPIAEAFPEVTEGEFTYEVTLEPTCVVAGQEIAATFRLKPNVEIVALPVYGDGPEMDPHQGHYYTGRTNEESVLVYRWRALPKPGTGILTTQARDRDTDKKGSVTKRFRVVPAGASC